MTNVIETHHLRKEYGDKVAVADLTLQIERGEVFGFLGPNGAGKTTVVKMLLGLAAPTAGTAQVLPSTFASTNGSRRRNSWICMGNCSG